MGDVGVGGWIGRSCGCPVGGGWVFVLETRFSVAGCVNIVSPRAF